MTKKTRKRGQSPFFERALTPVLLLLAVTSSHAQQAVIDRCKQTSSDADRIACLEAALLGKSLTPAPRPVAPEPAQVAHRVSKPQTTPQPVKPTGIGADQVVARNMTREDQLKSLEKAEGFIVASYETVPYEKLQVTLENGQVWRQIIGDTQKIRVDLKRNQTVDIEESSISGYKMQLNEMRRSLRVERVK